MSIFSRLTKSWHPILAKFSSKEKLISAVNSSIEAIILPLGRDSSTWNDSYLIGINTLIDEATFLSKAKVKSGTYAGELLTNLYNEIFIQSLELKRDYLDYYSLEYDSFDKYIRKQFLFTPEIVSAVNNQFGKCCQIIYFHPNYYFLQEGYGVEFLKKLFDIKGNL